MLNAGVYTKYTIAVTTSNSVGESSAPTEFVTGYSGEGNPKQVTLLMIHNIFIHTLPTKSIHHH